MHHCPYNEKFKFTVCDQTRCPYHTSRSIDLFNIKVDTACIKLDAPDVVSALSDGSLSSIDRTDLAKVNHRRIRRDIEETLSLAKSVINIYKELPVANFCKKCGAATQCEDAKLCNLRLDWINRAKAALKISNTNTMLYANIWNLLSQGKLDLNNAVLERHGRALLPSA